MTQPDRTPRKDKLLFTPGPLTTSAGVKQAMLRDVGSRDDEFVAVIKDIRHRLVRLANVDETEEGGGYTAVLMQGSGTFGIESVISSTVAPEGKLLVIVNGAYGQRMARIAATLGIRTVKLCCPEDEAPDVELVEQTLAGDPDITDVAVVHCETTSGILNPIRQIGWRAKQHGCNTIVDAMSSFGGVPIDARQCSIDYLVSSSNKCVESVPGFSFVIARKTALEKCQLLSRSLSLDLYAQWREFESSGQFRFTPPTHALLAFHRALLELEEEGGVPGRAERYKRSHRALLDGMRALGFLEYLPPDHQSTIITSFHYPDHPNFDFASFYRRLSERGFVIYPGKVSRAECFRIGTIGRIDEQDVRDLVAAIGLTLIDMGATPQEQGQYS